LNSPTSTSVEAEKGNPRSDSSRNSKDRTSKKRKKSSGANTDAKGDKLLMNPAPPPQKKQSLKPRMEREAELLNAISALQGEIDVLKHDIWSRY
jgi:hypothetical protein